MIRNPEKLARLKKSFTSGDHLSYPQSLAIFEAMWQEGVRLGVLPPADPLEGIETDLKIASILNSCSKNSSRD